MMGENVWHQKRNNSSSSKCPRSMRHPLFVEVTCNDSPQDALELEDRIDVQLYKLVRFCIFATFGNYLTQNETMWQYNLSTGICKV